MYKQNIKMYNKFKAKYFFPTNPKWSNPKLANGALKAPSYI